MAADSLLIPSLLPGVSLRVEGDEAAVRHFRAEYASDRVLPSPSAGPATSTDAELTVRFVTELPRATASQRHKTIRWSARLEQRQLRNLVLSIALSGQPRWFGLSLVQGYLVEPALSLLAVESSGVLLSAAAVAPDGAAMLLVGRSGTGKSSLAFRSLAAGVPFLGDDQVSVSADGTCRRFPRRLRLYDDARQTAPDAVAALPARHRRALAVRRLVRIGSLGFVAPSLAVPASAVRGAAISESAPLGTVILLARGPATDRPVLHSATVTDALDRCAEVSSAQRVRLRRALGEGWTSAFDDAGARERELLARAFGSVPITAVDVPDGIGAPSAVAAVAEELELP